MMSHRWWSFFHQARIISSIRWETKSSPTTDTGLQVTKAKWFIRKIPARVVRSDLLSYSIKCAWLTCHICIVSSDSVFSLHKLLERRAHLTLEFVQYLSERTKEKMWTCTEPSNFGVIPPFFSLVSKIFWHLAIGFVIGLSKVLLTDQDYKCFVSFFYGGGKKFK